MTTEMQREAWLARVEDARMRPEVLRVTRQYRDGLRTLGDLLEALTEIAMDSHEYAEERRDLALTEGQVDGVCLICARKTDHYAEHTEEEIGAWLRTVAVLG